MHKQILVIGGYGKVGRVIASQLAEQFPGRVIAAGRNAHKAEELFRQSGGKIKPQTLDINSVPDYDKLFEEVGLVVMCLDQKSAELAHQTIRRGIHYIDITASYPIISKIEALQNVASNSGSTAVLSVGLAPGLTNLLAKHCQSKIPEMATADIFVLLGLGEAHGEAAIRWIFENLDTEFSVYNHGQTNTVKSFEDGQKTVFPGLRGIRTAYRFNFSDQHVLPHTRGFHRVSTRLCFDSAWFTSIFSWMKRTGMSRILTAKGVQKIIISMMKRLQFGSDIFAVKVEGYGLRNGNESRYECSLRGHGEGKVTGQVAAKVASRLLQSSFPRGVFHIDQLFDLSEFLEAPGIKGFVFDEKNSEVNWNYK